MSDKRPRLLMAGRTPAPQMQSLLEGEGYQVESRQSARSVLTAVKSGRSHLCLLDLELGGVALAERLRQASSLGIILLGDAADRADGIAGLEAGADDCLLAPLEPRELLARIRRLLWRLAAPGAQCQGGPSQGSQRFFEGWLLDTSLRQLKTPGGKTLKLSAGECRLLSALVANAGQVMSRDQLSRQVCNRDWHPDDRYIDVHIAQIRRKLRRHDPTVSYIATIHGVGYLFVAAR